MAGGGQTQLTTSFARDVLPLFRHKDIDHMKRRGLDLSDINADRGAAASISARLKGTDGILRMPPPPDSPLTDEQTELFDKWVAEGFPPYHC